MERRDGRVDRARGRAPRDWTRPSRSATSRPWPRAQRDEERHAAEERTQRQQLQRVEQLIERAQKRSAAEDLTLREADRLARDLRSAARRARRRSRRTSRPR